MRACRTLRRPWFAKGGSTSARGMRGYPREIAAITGHRTLREIERYTVAGPKNGFTGKAMARLERP